MNFQKYYSTNNLAKTVTTVKFYFKNKEMKKTIPFIMIALFVGILSSCGPTRDQAVDYNDKIINEQIAIFEKMEQLIDTYENYQPDLMDAAYEKTLTQINQSIKNIEALPEFDGSTTFRDAGVTLFKLYKSVLENEHKQIIKLLKLPDSQYGDAEVKQTGDLSDAADEKINQGISNLDLIQSEFAMKYDFEIESGEAETDIE